MSPVSWTEENRREYKAKIGCPHGCGKPLTATLVIRNLPKGGHDIELVVEHDQ